MEGGGGSGGKVAEKGGGVGKDTGMGIRQQSRGGWVGAVAVGEWHQVGVLCRGREREGNRIVARTVGWGAQRGINQQRENIPGSWNIQRLEKTNTATTNNKNKGTSTLPQHDYHRY